MAPRESQGDPTTRVVVELSEPRPYHAKTEGEDLLLLFDAPPAARTGPVTQGRLEGKLIVVDPGHGGKDTGSPAIFGPPHQPPYEKDITLAIGLRLARLLRAEGARVTMTREDDTTIAKLASRGELANQLGADAFVSIHCNASDAPNSGTGTEVYYDHANSVTLARVVREELLSALGTQDRGTRNANWCVIRVAQCPGILVETAFINNDDDRRLLTDPIFQEATARAILKGVVRFFGGNQAAGSREE